MYSLRFYYLAKKYTKKTRDFDEKDDTIRQQSLA